MKNSDITQTIIHYLGNNAKNLQGVMPPKDYPYDKHFLVEGKVISETRRADTRIAIGTAVDILADTIEKKKFFGWYVDESVEQANNCNNAKLIYLHEDDKISGTFKISLRKECLIIEAERVLPKKYLDILRTPEGFIQSARLCGVEGNLERIASLIYNPK